MSLDANAKASNIYRSLYTYFYDNLFLEEGYHVNFEGVKFDELNKTEWLQPRVVDMFSQPIGNASSTQYGEQTDILFQVNIFVKKADMAYADRHYQIRDAVAYSFRSGTTIAIYDYSSGGTVAVDYMKVRRIVDDRPIPETQDLMQYVISFEIDYTKAVTK